MIRAKEELLSIEGSLHAKIYPERALFNKRLRYFRSGKASMEEFIEDMLRDAPLGGGAVTRSQRKKAEGDLWTSLALIKERAVAAQAAFEELHNAHAEKRPPRMAYAKRVDDAEERWKNNPLRKQFQDPAALKIVTDMKEEHLKQKSKTSWYDWVKYHWTYSLSSWAKWGGGLLLLAAFMYWLYTCDPKVQPCSLCHWIGLKNATTFLVDRTSSEYSRLVHGQTYEEKIKETEARKLGDGVGFLAVGVGCAVGGFLSFGVYASLCVGAAMVGGKVGGSWWGSTVAGQQKDLNNQYIATVWALVGPFLINEMGVGGGTADLFMKITQATRDISRTQTTIEKNMSGAAIGAAASLVNPVAGQAWAKVRDVEAVYGQVVNPKMAARERWVRSQADHALGLPKPERRRKSQRRKKSTTSKPKRRRKKPTTSKPKRRRKKPTSLGN